MDKHSLDNLHFDAIGEADATSLAREFEEKEVRAVVFALGWDRAPGPGRLLIAFFQCLWDITKQDVKDLVREFHLRSKLPKKNLGAFFITLIPKKHGADSLEDFRPISLIDSIFKILAKFLVERLIKLMPFIIS